jgi:hypothetical protein
MKDVYISDRDTLTDDVEVELNMFGVLVLYEVG